MKEQLVNEIISWIDSTYTSLAKEENILNTLQLRNFLFNSKQNQSTSWNLWTLCHFQREAQMKMFLEQHWINTWITGGKVFLPPTISSLLFYFKSIISFL